jgi:hypothetical protein
MLRKTKTKKKRKKMRMRSRQQMKNRKDASKPQRSVLLKRLRLSAARRS